MRHASRIAPLLALAALACGGAGPSDPTGGPLPARVRPSPPAVPAEWAAWLQGHHFPIRSTAARDTDFGDLQFLRGVIGDRRIVQLGESGHGVAEFDSVKVRLIQFLHQQMGFDVIAFESGLYECFRADEQVDTLTADALMRHCIFAVWHAEETLPLFEYVKASRGSGRPLTLAGFDTQFSTAYRNQRAAEVREVVAAIDAAAAEEAYALDTELLSVADLGQNGARAALVSRAADMIAGYERIADLVEGQQGRLERAFPSRPQLPLVVGRALRMAPSLIRSLAGSASEYGAHRDEGMAANVTWLAEQLYPGRKIIVWAHNYHVQHDASELPTPAVTMGSYVLQRHRHELYTVGLFMYWGQAAWNNRTVYDVRPPSANSLEALLGRAPGPASFVDLLGQPPSPGTAWMDQPIVSRSWGYNDERLTHRNQYDGILFVDEAHPPSYR